MKRSTRPSVKFGNRAYKSGGVKSIPDQLPVLIFLMVSLSIILICVLSYWAFLVWDQVKVVPVSLHSVLVANYKADPRSMKLPPLQLSIIWDALDDQSDVRSRQSSDIDALIGLTPTDIATFDPNNTLVPTLPISIIDSATPTRELSSPSATPIFSSSVTSSPIFTLTFTPSATFHLFTSTPTQVAMTRTPSATPRISSTPTPTWWVPTATTTIVNVTQPVATRTPSPTSTTLPSPTPVTPMPTPRPTNTPDPYPPPDQTPYP